MRREGCAIYFGSRCECICFLDQTLFCFLINMYYFIRESGRSSWTVLLNLNLPIMYDHHFDEGCAFVLSGSLGCPLALTTSLAMQPL
jgi:hypothetical protein